MHGKMISCAKNCFCFQQVKSDDTSTAGIAKFLSELFTCFQNIRSIVRKRQQQLKLIREAERQASADPTRMNAAEQREMEKRMREQDARSMMDMRFVSAVPVPHTHAPAAAPRLR